VHRTISILFLTMQLLKIIHCLLLFLIFSPYGLEAQLTIKKINHLLNRKKPIDAIYRLCKSNKEDPFLICIKRTVDGGHTQIIARIKDYDKYYDILVQENGKKGYLAVINEMIYKKGADILLKNILFKIDSLHLTSFVAIHDSIYNSLLKIDSFKTFSIKQYAAACGSGGVASPEFAEMTDLVSRYDTTSLIKWIQHFDYESKIMGATGLLILQKKGIQLNNSTLAIIVHLKKLNVPINQCFGCMSWDPASSQVLLDKEIIEFTKDFIRL